MPYRKKYQKKYRCQLDCGFKNPSFIKTCQHEWKEHKISASALYVDITKAICEELMRKSQLREI
jgi:hypothetical protein